MLDLRFLQITIDGHLRFRSKRPFLNLIYRPINNRLQLNRLLPGAVPPQARNRNEKSEVSPKGHEASAPLLDGPPGGGGGQGHREEGHEE